MLLRTYKLVTSESIFVSNVATSELMSFEVGLQQDLVDLYVSHKLIELQVEVYLGLLFGRNGLGLGRVKYLIVVETL